MSRIYVGELCALGPQKRRRLRVSNLMSEEEGKSLLRLSGQMNKEEEEEVGKERKVRDFWPLILSTCVPFLLFPSCKSENRPPSPSSSLTCRGTKN